MDEVFAQLSAERAAGLADEPQLRPEATLTPGSISSTASTVQLQAGPGLADIAAAADAAPQQYMQSLVEGPAAAAAVVAGDDAMAAFDHMRVPANGEQHPNLRDCVAAVEEPLHTTADAVVVDEAPDTAMAAFDHMSVPATGEQHPNLADCVAAVEEPLHTTADAVVVDEAPDTAMAAFDHMSVPATGEQHPNLADCVAAVEEPLLTTAVAVVVDEAPDTAMAAFDHTSLDTPAAAAVAGGNQTPSLQDIALAAEPTSLPASLEESLGEDEEPDTVLAAFDHILVPEAPAPAAAAAVPEALAAAASVAAVPEAPAAAAAVAAVAAAVLGSADEAGSGYDQAFLDPVQPSASVGSGSVDLADLEADVVVVTTPAATGAVTPAKVAAAMAAAAPAAPAAVAAAPVVKQQEQRGGQEGGDLGAVLQGWWVSVMQMFEEWQKNLAGSK